MFKNHTSRRALIRFLIGLNAMLLHACTPPAPETEAASSTARTTVALNISGSATLGEHLMPQLVLSFLNSEQYEILNATDTLFQAQRNDTLFNIRINPIGTGEGLRQLKTHQADLAMVSETIDSAFLKQKNRSSAKVIFIAKGRVSIIAHRHNLVSVLTKAQLKAIFSGEITDWAVVAQGQYSGRINPHSRNTASGTTHIFESFLLGKPQKYMVGKQHVTNKSLLEDMKRDFYGIGFISENELPYDDDNIVKQITVIDNNGSPQVIERPLSLVYTEIPTDNSLLQHFTRFCRSDLAQNIAVSMGFFK